MVRVAHVVGIDPGLVHTGCVRMVFDTITKRIDLDHYVVNGLNIVDAAVWVKGHGLDEPAVFIEGYRPRHNLAPDKRMVEAVAALRGALPGAEVLNNMGVTKTVPQPLMALLGAWTWPSVTHHQDLRSAARIALLGMMKDTVLNRLLAGTVEDHLDGRTWGVTHR